MPVAIEFQILEDLQVLIDEGDVKWIVFMVLLLMI